MKKRPGRALIPTLAAMLCIAALPSIAAQPVAPQTLDVALANTQVQQAMKAVDAAEDRATSTLIELASIISPSGREFDRAAAVAARMREIGLVDVRLDGTPNVVGALPGTSGSALVFVTMLDDLPAIESLQRSGVRAQRDGDRIIGPATEIQSTVAAMLVAAEALAASGVRLRHDVIFAAVAREETGLQGMKALYEQLEDRALAFVEVLGDGRQIDYNGAGAVAWWRIVAHGQEGHTADQTLPNVNHAIAQAVDEVFALAQRERTRSDETFINVGILRSGEAFNRRPGAGWFSLDVRSEDRAAVEEIAQKIAALLARVEARTGVRLEMVPDFQSMGGEIAGAMTSPLARTARGVSQHLGYEPEFNARGCCNMRVAIEGGSLAIALHGERGGERGSAGEWASVPAMMNTARHIVLLAATVAGASG